MKSGEHSGPRLDSERVAEGSQPGAAAAQGMRMPWSIGLYAGSTPTKLEPLGDASRPILDASRVDDVPAHFVADPFAIECEGSWFLFFEVLRSDTGLGEIGLAVRDQVVRDQVVRDRVGPGDGSDPTGLATGWSYRGIVLREPYHLSYPSLVVEPGNDEIYMVPETLDAGSVRIYRAVRFPEVWEPVADLVPGQLADPTIFFHAGQWWLFACSTPYQHDTLRLYGAESLLGPWREHPESPLIVGDRARARPCGKPIRWGRRLLRLAQDCEPIYGRRVRVFEILELSPTTYRERELPESPILEGTGHGWNALKMHHLDAHRWGEDPSAGWLAFVDGRG